MKKSIIIIAVASVSVLLAACCACRKGSPKLGTLETNGWKLVEFENKAVPESKSVTLSFDPEKKMLFGQAPCNNFFGSYKLLEATKKSPNNIEFGAMGATRKFCPDSEIEDAFGREISDVTRVKIDGDKLLMMNANGNLVGVLKAVPKPDMR